MKFRGTCAMGAIRQVGGGVVLASLLGLPFASIAASPGPVTAPPPGACQRLAGPPDEQEISVPFDVVDGRIYVQAQVNGRGPFRFAVDTGASGMARADARLVAALGLPIKGKATTSDGVQSASVNTTHLDTLALGGLARQDLEVITRDYGSRMAAAARFDGILGREFFADGLLVIDYPRKRLSFSRAHAIAATDPHALAYERAFRVPVSIGEVHTLGNLDTGANVAFVLPRSLYERVGGGPLEAAGQGRLTNGTVALQKATLAGPIHVGSVDYSNVEVRVSERFPELLVGAHALQDAVLLIDQRSKRVALCR
ncbi:retropepsin-like aspartic protease [Lysobacter olei]